MRKLNFLGALTVVGAVTLTGCGGKKREQKNVDTSMAQLEISTFDGGVGDEWLTNAANLFMEKNKERTDFEEGKTGCQIWISKDRFGGDYLLESDFQKDIYFTENIDYYRLSNKNKLMDITDILTEENPEDNNKRIIDKIDPNLKDFMNRGGKYYAVPFYDCIYGLVYDKDLFEEKSFYMTDAGGFTNDPTLFGTGPNGVPGDWDDGLPKTYEQFKSMIQMMRTRQVTPFVYSNNSEVSFYTARALMSYWSDDEGFEQTNLNYTFNGTASNIITGWDGDNPTTESVPIDKDNGYLLRQQKGFYNALKFAKEILCSTPENYLATSNNTTAQTAFVANKYSGGSNKPAAMLFEGTWWENESTTAFDIAKSYGASEFNFGLMPIPKSHESKVGQDATFLNLNNSYGIINANSKQVQLAKEFFKFLHTDEQLRQFTVTTSMTRGLNYSLEAEDLAKVSTFAKDLIAIKQSEHVKTVYPVSGLDYFINNSDTFHYDTWIFGSKTKGNSPFVKFTTEPTLSAKGFFQDRLDLIDESAWNRIPK